MNTTNCTVSVLAAIALSSCSSEASAQYSAPVPTAQPGPAAPTAPTERPMEPFVSTSIDEGREMLTDTEGLVLLDVRTPGETAGGIIPGAILIPMDEIPNRIDEIPEGPLLVYCHVGQRSAAVCDFLAQQGRTELHNLEGGISSWTGEIVKP
ncbi:MAG: rhodanese-related sulfurtransferase [Planctomycetota bacterium]|jgi:rhodanese-related sulfurtransferase